MILPSTFRFLCAFVEEYEEERGVGLWNGNPGKRLNGSFQLLSLIRRDLNPILNAQTWGKAKDNMADKTVVNGPGDKE